MLPGHKVWGNLENLENYAKQQATWSQKVQLGKGVGSFTMANNWSLAEAAAHWPLGRGPELYKGVGITKDHSIPSSEDSEQLLTPYHFICINEHCYMCVSKMCVGQFVNCVLEGKIINWTQIPWRTQRHFVSALEDGLGWELLDLPSNVPEAKPLAGSQEEAWFELQGVKVNAPSNCRLCLIFLQYNREWFPLLTLQLV